MMEKIPPNISRIQLQLMLNQPYLASAVARLPLIPVNNSDHVPTMATDGYHIFVNPSFCDKLTEQFGEDRILKIEVDSYYKNLAHLKKTLHFVFLFLLVQIIHQTLRNFESRKFFVGCRVGLRLT